MNNLILFVNQFLSYFVLFALTVVLVIIAAITGASVRKAKDKKEALAEQDYIESGE